ncbi:YdbC family protein [Jeotgalibacillus sp. JSM ZJ347]|uniref:YdbC family protein n=1 Tax=Jeotgalibacillus sp. JSM ZJ347 TaxID=3342117 RepID=UPI0035A8D989
MGKNSTSKNTFFLFQYLEREGLEYIDKRDKKGVLWILGDSSLENQLSALKEHKLYFCFSEKGSRSTGGRPAWYLTNKDVNEQPNDYNDHMSNLNFEVIEVLKVLSEGSKDWKKELTLISWNEGEPKYDIRSWSPDHEKMGKGVTFTLSELQELKNVLNDMPELD